MSARPSSHRHPLFALLEVMARLRAPDGCPWDREQDHHSLRFHAVEEVYELIDAIEAGDDHELREELGDLLLQVVFHCQLAQERGAFDFAAVARHLVDKLIRRHPHVFGTSRVRSVEAVWAQWDKIKRAEKAGTRHERPSALDGIPQHLPGLLRAEKLVKKARKAGLAKADEERRETVESVPPRLTPAWLGRALFDLTAAAQRRGWSAEALLRSEIQRRERAWRRREAQSKPKPSSDAPETPRKRT